jgi:hypothetical protein
MLCWYVHGCEQRAGRLVLCNASVLLSVWAGVAHAHFDDLEANEVYCFHFCAEYPPLQK